MHECWGVWATWATGDCVDMVLSSRCKKSLHNYDLIRDEPGHLSHITGHCNASSRAFASCKSAVSKPSVNQP